MGLDMYLKASKRMPVEAALLMMKADPDRYPELYNPWAPGAGRKSVELITEAAYWRKANIIHRWFVHNVQDGVDECQPHTVSKKQLEQLLESCRDVLHGAPAERYGLTPMGGFFFGPTDDEAWNREQLQKTVKMIEEVLERCPDWKYTYQSSW